MMPKTIQRELNVYLTKKQRLLLKYFKNPKITEILYWWWARWWKSWWVCEIINAMCTAYPWIVWLIWRREWDDLRKTTLNTLKKVLYKRWYVKWVDYTINLQTKELIYRNTSKILFVPLKEQPSDPEFNRLWWYEITYWFVDEAQEVSRKAIDIILSRCTEKVVEYDLQWKVVMTCNPMKCHLYSDFIKPYKEWKLAKDRVFISALYKDNPYIDHKKYEESLKRADRVTKERLLFWNREYDDDPTKLYAYDDILDLFSNPWKEWEKYITADIARLGDDKTVIIVRDWLIWKLYSYEKKKITETVAIIRKLQQFYWVKNSHTLCDEDWVWWWVVDALGCKGFINNSSPILSEKDKELRNYKNLKDQCYFELKPIIDWSSMQIQVVDEEDKALLIEELDVVKQKNHDRPTRLEILTKKEVKELIWRSPDRSDAVAMRMWFELAKEDVAIYYL